MKSLFIKVAISGVALCTSFNLYGIREGLLNTNPKDSLRTAMRTRASEVHNAIQEAEHEGNPWTPINYCLFDRQESIPEPVLSEEEQNAKKKAYLESDNIALKHAKGVLRSISDEIAVVEKTLKTAAAKSVLAAMLQGSAVIISDIESFLEKCSKRLPKKYPFGTVDYLLHERFQKAFQKATTVLIDHVTAGILVGSTDEQSDLETLCNCLRGIAPDLDQVFEENAFHGALRGKYSECYDSISQEDIIARFRILNKVLEVSDKAFKAADDGDDFEVGYSLVEVAENYVNATRLWFVNKTHPKMQAFIFQDQNVFKSFESFLQDAPDLFKFCTSNTGVNVQAELLKKKWQRWVYKGQKLKYVKSDMDTGTQVIMISPDGSISTRLKQDGSFSVGFLAAYSPHAHKSFSDYLFDRGTELLKHCERQGFPLELPAALNGDTPFWNPAGQKLVNAFMADAHGKLK